MGRKGGLSDLAILAMLLAPLVLVLLYFAITTLLPGGGIDVRRVMPGTVTVTPEGVWVRYSIPAHTKRAWVEEEGLVVAEGELELDPQGFGRAVFTVFLLFDQPIEKLIIQAKVEVDNPASLEGREGCCGDYYYQGEERYACYHFDISFSFYVAGYSGLTWGPMAVSVNVSQWYTIEIGRWYIKAVDEQGGNPYTHCSGPSEGEADPRTVSVNFIACLRDWKGKARGYVRVLSATPSKRG